MKFDQSILCDLVSAIHFYNCSAKFKHMALPTLRESQQVAHPDLSRRCH